MGVFDFFEKPDAIPSVPKFVLPNYLDSFKDFNAQLESLPALADTTKQINQTTNKQYQDSIFSLVPGLQGTLTNLSTNAEDFSKGQVPQDVQDFITRSTAYKNFSAGIAPLGGQGQGVAAKNLGLTSLDMIRQSAALAPGLLSMSQALNPSQVSVNQMLYSPGQLLGRRDQQAQIDYQTKLQNQQIAFANSQRQSGFDQLLGNTLASVVSAPFQSIQSMAGIAGNAPQIALSMCGGGGGGMGGGAQIPMSNYGGMSSFAGGMGGIPMGGFGYSQPVWAGSVGDAMGGMRGLGNFTGGYGGLMA